MGNIETNSIKNDINFSAEPFNIIVSFWLWLRCIQQKMIVYPIRDCSVSHVSLYNLNIRDCSVSIKRLLCIPCSIVTFPIKDCCVSYARLYHILYEIVPFPIRDCTISYTRLYHIIYEIVVYPTRECNISHMTL